ncbi:hypothetical protein KVV02_003171 [Mortierella alpina]|uniref:TOG domain-containing protein n=1 Tax=Mortierella alpina TaxID=64518 RepID=A0A9P8D0Z5_MORAP|nr:hypothetical protein KVV02_003171 [Mortierella alpina]
MGSVPFAAGSLGSHNRHPEDGADDQLIVSLRDRNSAESQTGAPLQSNPQALQEYLMVLAPQRLPYEIQMASGWDVGYPPEELVGLMQKSAGKGWHTPRFCTYPQDLVLRFSCGHSRIRKIQILSHQYKIPSRLDFWMGSRKGVQSVSADPAGDGTQSVAGSEADQDGAYREHGEPDDDEDDDGLDLIPRMPVQKNLPVLQFQKLGSISFDSNAASNYSGRELRSINFDVEGEYLRVVIRQCHVNPLNIYHQVAILALNVLGEPLEDELLADSERLDFDEVGFFAPEYAAEQAVDVQNLTSAVPALSVAEMKEQHTDYMDQEMRNIAAAFINAKLNAVKVEDFQSAKLFKTGYDEMTKFADRVQELDAEKHQAAENDDFDLAQELKAKVADVKARMHSQLSLNGFFIISEGDATIVSLTPPDTIDEDVGDETSFAGSKSFSASHLLSNMDVRNTSIGSAGSSGRKLPISRRSVPAPSNQSRRSPATSDSSDLDKMRKEDYPGRIPLPSSRSFSMGVSKKPEDTSMRSRTNSPYKTTLSSNHSYALDQTSQSGLMQEEESIILSKELTEQEQATFAVPLQVFSAKIISGLISRELQLRQHAIEHVKEHLENECYADEIDQLGDPALLAKAAFQVISVALADTREKVVTITLALLDQAVKYSLQNEVPSAIAYRSLEPVFAQLLVRASDLNTRVANGAINKIVMLCNCFRSHPYAILPLVFRPARGTVLYKQAESRVGIVARLVDEFGVHDSVAGKGTPGGLDFENITEFAVPYLSHTNGEVRVAARRLIIDVCKFLNKTRVEQFLPGVKPLIVESIQKELEPKRSTITPGHSPAPSRSTANTSGIATGPSLRASQSSSSSGKRRPIPTPLGVNLHMDSLKSLLVEPDSPGFSKSGRQSSRQRSETALAHQARLKMPLRQTAKATQDIYTGVPRAMVKKQSALSPDDENDSTASEETRPSATQTSTVPRTTARSLQPRSKVGAARPKVSGSDQQSGSDTPSQSKSPKDRFCVFCDERSSAFTDEGLVAHYWSDCAMLANCSYCKIIIEVPTLAEHMLKECSRRKFVKQCESCKEIMPADSFLAHVAAGCKAVKATTVRCPLCQVIMSQSDEAAWKRHLMRGSGCPMNKKSATIDLQRPGAFSPAANLAPPSGDHNSPASTIATTPTPTRRYTTSSAGVQSGATLSPTSPLSSSSSSTRVDTSVRYAKGAESLLSPPIHYPDSIHPFDPVPPISAYNASSSSSSLMHSSSASSVGSAPASSTSGNSRIPKPGNFRSISTNSVSSMSR